MFYMFVFVLLFISFELLEKLFSFYFFIGDFNYDEDLKENRQNKLLVGYQFMGNFGICQLFCFFLGLYKGKRIKEIIYYREGCYFKQLKSSRENYF